jgi:hypothetical protein
MGFCQVELTRTSRVSDQSGCSPSQLCLFAEPTQKPPLALPQPVPHRSATHHPGCLGVCPHAGTHPSHPIPSHSCCDSCCDDKCRCDIVWEEAQVLPHLWRQRSVETVNRSVEQRKELAEHRVAYHRYAH